MFNVFSSCFSAVLSCRKEMMRRKRSCSTHQTSIVNVHAVVLGLDGVGKSGKFAYTKNLTRIFGNYSVSFGNSSLNYSLQRFELKGS